MAFGVRIFGYRGIVQMLNVLPKQYSADSVFVLEQPYLFRQKLTAGGVAVSSAPDMTQGVQLLRIEVPDGQAIRYEINSTGRSVDAFDGSPILSGMDQFKFAPGWILSIIDAAGLP